MESNKKYRNVLITGGSSGIGLELARCFAKDNYNIVLVARNEARLRKTADQLQKEGAGKVLVISKDLSRDGAAAEVYEETHSRGIDIHILVNDAGVGEYGLFRDSDIHNELSLIHLNIISLVHLTKLYLQDMLHRDGGKIMQLGSVASYQPTPKLAVYAATKAFVLSFTDALIHELQDTNVHVTLLIPGPTDTDFFNKAGAEETKAAVEDPEDPAVVAKIGYEALMNETKHAVAPGMRKHIVMSSALPNEAVSSMAENFMKKSDKVES